MAHINLLPWREELKRQRRIEFFTTLAVFAVLTLATWGYVHLHFTQMIKNQMERNQYLEKEIATLDKQIKQIDDLEKQKDRMLARMDIIQQLQRSRPMVVRLFEQVVKILPEGVYLNSLSHSRDTLSMQGKAQSNSRVSALMRNIEHSEWLTAPNLGFVSGSSKSQQPADAASIRRNFKMQAKQTAPKKEGEEAAG
jgi:type IV pilus assembly protein PilN